MFARYSNEDLLDSLIETAHRISIVSESDFIADIRAELLSRLTLLAPDAVDSTVISIIPHADSVFYLEGES